MWRLIHYGGSWGLWRFRLEAAQLDRVRRAMSRAQCWIVWDGSGPFPVSLEQWRDRLSRSGLS